MIYVKILCLLYIDILLIIIKTNYNNKVIVKTNKLLYI